MKMKLFNKLHSIFDMLPELSDDEINNAHNDVLDAFEKLSVFIHDKYKYLDLIDIVVIKSYGINTGLDGFYYRYLRIKNAISKILPNNYLSSIFAYYLIGFVGSKLNKNHKESFDEIDLVPDTSNEINCCYKTGHCNLFVANTQAYLLVMINYIARSSLENHLLVIPRSLRNCEVVNKAGSINIIYFDDYCDDVIFNEYCQQKQYMEEVFLNYNKDIEAIFNIKGMNFFKHVVNGIENIFAQLIPESILYSLVVENICKEISVTNIIGARVRKIYDRAFYSFARRNNINSYVLLHSNLMRNLKLNHATGHFNNITGVFVWNESQRETINNDKFSSVKNIFLTGSPLFEKYENEVINLINRNKIIFACGSNDMTETSMFVDAVHKMHDSEIIIKVHPNIKSDEYIKLVRNKNITVLPGESSFENLLKSSKLVVTLLSEAGLHSMFREIPTIFIILEEKYNKLFDVMYESTEEEKKLLVATNTKELSKKINDILQHNEYFKNYIDIQNRFLKKNFIRFDEKFGSTIRIDKVLC
jgi:hypothetical protein